MSARGMNPGHEMLFFSEKMLKNRSESESEGVFKRFWTEGFFFLGTNPIFLPISAHIQDTYHNRSDYSRGETGGLRSEPKVFVSLNHVIVLTNPQVRAVSAVGKRDDQPSLPL